MANRAQTFEQAKATRDEAREAFDAQRALVRSDLDERSVGSRVVDRIAAEASAVLQEGKTVADEHRGIVAGTIAVLALWFLRGPIINGIDSLLAGDDPD